MGGFPVRAFNNIQAHSHNLFAQRDLLGVLGADASNSWWVDSTNGSNNSDGRTRENAKATLTAVLALAVSGDFIFMVPGQYDESPSIARTQSKLTIIGVGGRGSVFIEPTTEDADGLTCHADDVTIVNVGIAAEDETAGNYALTLTGSRFRAYGCKIEGGEDQVRIGPGTVAQVAASTHGVGADCLFDDCELAWGTNGFNLVCTDYGAVTQLFVQNCRFHDLTASSFKETVGSGGAAAVMFFGLQIRDCLFDDLEDGTAPTRWIILNGNNANAGIVAGNRFPSAINGGKNLVSTALHWVSNYHTGGVSTGQPS